MLDYDTQIIETYFKYFDAAINVGEVDAANNSISIEEIKNNVLDELSKIGIKTDCFEAKYLAKLITNLVCIKKSLESYQVFDLGSEFLDADIVFDLNSGNSALFEVLAYRSLIDTDVLLEYITTLKEEAKLEALSNNEFIYPIVRVIDIPDRVNSSVRAKN